MKTRNEILDEVCKQLKALPEVRSLTIHGSLANGSVDHYSDIDLQLDLSGADNGPFMLTLPEILGKSMKIGYVAYATRFIPDLYLITIHFENSSAFHFVDIECLATPHAPSVTREDILKISNNEGIILKSAINCLKQMLRGATDSDEINRIYGFKFTSHSKSPEDKLTEIFDYFARQPNPSIKQTANECLDLIKANFTIPQQSRASETNTNEG